MVYRYPCLQALPSSIFPTFTAKVLSISVMLLCTLAFAQEQAQPAAPPDSAQVQGEPQNSNITIPAGTIWPLC